MLEMPAAVGANQAGDAPLVRVASAGDVFVVAPFPLLDEEHFFCDAIGLGDLQGRRAEGDQVAVIAEDNQVVRLHCLGFGEGAVKQRPGVGIGVVDGFEHFAVRAAQIAQSDGQAATGVDAEQ